MGVHYENSNTIQSSPEIRKHDKRSMVTYNNDVMLFWNLFLETNNMTMQSRILSEIGLSILYYN